MSRAFVKELDGQEEALPERPQSPHTNYVTPRGLEQLQEQVRELSAMRTALEGRDDLEDQQQRKRVERDLHYYAERVARAVLVRPEAQPDDKVHFGAAVEVEDAEGQRQRFAIVGEDEADAAQGRISWVSPLAKALLNARIGDLVTWRRPLGDKQLEIVAIGKGGP
jgi:transcription elongation GreA/GreB family factor